MMKKLFSVVIAALFMLMPASAIHYDDYDTTKVWMNKTEFFMCFDRVSLEYPDGTVKRQTELFDVGAGSANTVINEHPIYLKNEVAVHCYGWTGIKDSDAVTKLYGYKVNESEPVFDNGFMRNAEQAVYRAGGDSRFEVRIPVENTGAPILLTVVSKDTDGVVRDVLEFSVNGEYISKNSSRIPPFERVLKEIKKDRLTVAVTGGTDYNPVVRGSEFTVSVDLVNNIAADTAELYIRYDPDLSFVGAEFPTDDPLINISASAKDDKASHTVRIKWIPSDTVEGDCTAAKLTFRPDADIEKGFLHISAETETGYVKHNDREIAFCALNGGADVIPCVPGDVNGDGKTSNKDVTLLFRSISGGGADVIGEAADTDGDGDITNKDVSLLFRIVCGAAKADILSLIKPDTYEETTGIVKNVTSWTFNDGTAGRVIGIYCETEPDAEVFVCDENGTVILKERSLYGYFYGRIVMPFEKTSQKVYIYAKAEGKAMSKTSRAYTLEYSDKVGNGAIIGKDSHVYLNYYKAHYSGQAALSEEQAQGRMTNIKNKLYAKLDEIRARTGKNTKIIILICTNPATVYHSLQYSEEEKGWGDYDLPTSVTQFGEFMKDDENIYMLDMRQILSEHTDRLLFAQADSHWTQIAGYYGYYLTAQKIKQDFPATKVYDLDADFDTSIYPGGGDLLGFMGASGTKAVWASVTPKSDDMTAPASAPTAYWMGDSYYHNISPYFKLLFSKVYLNEFESQPHPPLYNYTLDDLENRQPDYLFYVWTERNVDAVLSWFDNTIVNEAS